MPFRSRADLQARDQLKQRLLDQANQALRACVIPPYLLPQTVVPAAKESDIFMPVTWWRSQNPDNIPGYWAECCNTVKKMVGYNASGRDRVQIVLEHGRSLRVQPTAAAGFAMLDRYMDLRQPVMTGVNHTYGMTYNEKTTDHFVAIVGTGVENKRKYYRFFDVGTTKEHHNKGTDPSNRLYYDPRTGICAGKSAVNNKTYTLSQLRFKPGTF